MDRYRHGDRWDLGAARPGRFKVNGHLNYEDLGTTDRNDRPLLNVVDPAPCSEVITVGSSRLRFSRRFRGGRLDRRASTVGA